MSRSYFDYAASAPLDPRARSETDSAAALVGNPSSTHAEGRVLRELVERSRDSVASLLGVRPAEIVFASGATEANVSVLTGLVRAARVKFGDRPLRVLASGIEHASVEAVLPVLEKEFGVAIDRIPVGPDGVTSIAELDDLITDETLIVCVMWANNVVGTVQPIAEIGKKIAAIRAGRGLAGLPLYFVCDAVQALSTQDVRPTEHGIDALTCSGHKICGPKGIGALYLKTGTPFEPLIPGGGQESGRRSGTENAPAIAGFGRACELLAAERDGERARLIGLRQRLIAGLAGIGGAAVFGAAEKSLPGTIFVSGREGGDILALKFDAAGIAVSAGSACDAGSRKKSGVLDRIGVRALARGGVRISFGRFTADADVERLLEVARRILK